MSTDDLRRTSVGRMRSVEGARGVAAFIVVLMHAANLMAVEHFSGHVGLGGIFGFGYVGVDFFFVLSGFIISFVHFGDIGKPRRMGFYLSRRIFRIYPIYLFCLSLSVLVLLAGRFVLHKDTPLGFTVSDVAGTIFLLPVSEPQFVGVAWSLQFEIMFYALFAILILSKRFGVGLFSLWAAVIVWRLLFFPSIPSFGGFLSAYSLQFLFGVVTGVTMSTRDFKWVGKPMLVLGIAGFAAAAYYERYLAVIPHGALGQVFLGLSAAVILFSLVEMEKSKVIQTPGFMYKLGSISYSIYLSHIIFINLIYSVMLKLGIYQRLPELVIFIIAVLGALACASLIGFLVELPFAKWIKGLAKAKEPRPEGVSISNMQP
ncbi:MAG: acyltransferase [Pseudomonadota bacterium]